MRSETAQTISSEVWICNIRLRHSVFLFARAVFTFVAVIFPTRQREGARCILFFLFLCQLVAQSTAGWKNEQHEGETDNWEKFGFFFTKFQPFYKKKNHFLLSEQSSYCDSWPLRLSEECKQVLYYGSNNHNGRSSRLCGAVAFIPHSPYREKLSVKDTLVVLKTDKLSRLSVHFIHTTGREEPVELVCFYSTHKEPMFITHQNMSPYLVSSSAYRGSPPLDWTRNTWLCIMLSLVELTFSLESWS